MHLKTFGTFLLPLLCLTVATQSKGQSASQAPTSVPASVATAPSTPSQTKSYGLISVARNLPRHPGRILAADWAPKQFGFGSPRSHARHRSICVRRSGQQSQPRPARLSALAAGNQRCRSFVPSHSRNLLLCHGHSDQRRRNTSSLHAATAILHRRCSIHLRRQESLQPNPSIYGK